jgi:hypothetical protein
VGKTPQEQRGKGTPRRTESQMAFFPALRPSVALMRSGEKKRLKRPAIKKPKRSHGAMERVVSQKATRRFIVLRATSFRLLRSFG